MYFNSLSTIRVGGQGEVHLSAICLQAINKAIEMLKTKSWSKEEESIWPKRHIMGSTETLVLSKPFIVVYFGFVLPPFVQSLWLIVQTLKCGLSSGYGRVSGGCAAVNLL